MSRRPDRLPFVGEKFFVGEATFEFFLVCLSVLERALALLETDPPRRSAVEEERADSGGLEEVDSAREWVRFEEEEAALGLEPRTEALGSIVPDDWELNEAGCSRKGEGRGPGKNGEFGDDNAESWREPEFCEARDEVREREEEE